MIVTNDLNKMEEVENLARRKAEVMKLCNNFPKGTPNYAQIHTLIQQYAERGLIEDDVLLLLNSSITIHECKKAIEERHTAKERKNKRKKARREERKAKLARKNRLLKWGRISVKVIPSEHLLFTYRALAKTDEYMRQLVSNAKECLHAYNARVAEEQSRKEIELQREHLRRARAAADKLRKQPSNANAADREDAYEYVHLSIPREQLNEFRRWCVRTYGSRIDDLFGAVNAFVAAHPAKPTSQSTTIADNLIQPPTKIALPITAFPVKLKREGSEVVITSRPDQANFSEAVRYNCFDRCVITGATTRWRNEAAHIIEHKHDGPDHYTNGLLLRIDLHRLFDKNLLAICPQTLTVHITPELLVDDPDLNAYQGKLIAELRHPVNPDYLIARWEAFQQLSCEKR